MSGGIPFIITFKTIYMFFLNSLFFLPYNLLDEIGNPFRCSVFHLPIFQTYKNCTGYPSKWESNMILAIVKQFFLKNVFYNCLLGDSRLSHSLHEQTRKNSRWLRAHVVLSDAVLDTVCKQISSPFMWHCRYQITQCYVWLSVRIENAGSGHQLSFFVNCNWLIQASFHS